MFSGLVPDINTMKITQIPLQYYPILTQLIEFDDKIIEEIVQSLKIAQPTLQLEELTKTVASQVKTISQKSISEILEFVISLYSLSDDHEFSQQDVVNFLGDFLQNSEEFIHISLNQVERFKHRLSRLMEPGGVLPCYYFLMVKAKGTQETWQLGENRQAYGVQNLDPTVPELEKTFLELAHQWRRETRGISSTNKASMHPIYQQIIGMGKAVIPLLLRELERNSGQWFWAIQAISREDPVPPEKRGQTQEMIRYWLEWGKQKGYRW